MQHAATEVAVGGRRLHAAPAAAARSNEQLFVGGRRVVKKKRERCRRSTATKLWQSRPSAPPSAAAGGSRSQLVQRRQIGSSSGTPHSPAGARPSLWRQRQRRRECWRLDRQGQLLPTMSRRLPACWSRTSREWGRVHCYAHCDRLEPYSPGRRCRLAGLLPQGGHRRRAQAGRRVRGALGGAHQELPGEPSRAVQSNWRRGAEPPAQRRRRRRPRGLGSAAASLTLY